MTVRPPVSERDGFIKLTLQSPPLTVQHARVIFGPHVDRVAQRLVERVIELQQEKECVS